MKKISVLITTSFLFCTAILFFSSCSSIGLMSEKNRWLLNEIDSVGDFLRVYIVLQISIFLIAAILSIFLGKVGYMISLVLHLIWVVSYRDYGFVKVALLFFLFTIISTVLSNLFGKKRMN